MPVALRGRTSAVLSRAFSWIERAGNRLPHPFMLFVYLAALIMLVSALVSLFGVTVQDPETGGMVAVRSLLSGDGLVYALTSMLSNFAEFPPLALVVVMMFGIGLAQQVGLIETTITKIILAAPARLVTAAVFLVGICGNLASDAALIIIPPLAALVFHALGRHPLAGLAAGFTAAGAGFSANLFIAGTDALLSGISTQAAGIVNDQASVSVVANWYFMIASTLLLTVVGVVVTEKFVEPRLGRYDDTDAEAEATTARTEVCPQAVRGLRNAALAGAGYLAVVVTVVLLPGSPLRNDQGDLLPKSPLLESVVPLIFLLFVVVAVAYGVTVGTIGSTADVPRLMTEAVKSLSGFLVLVFAAAQAIAYFEWSHLGLWIAVNGANLLDSVNVSGLTGLVIFSLLTVVLSMFIASGSALWSIEAPIFVPMFMLQDINPAYTQIAYRIADSSTNSIVPLSPYIAIMLGFMQEYNKKAGLGTLFALILPYTLAFYISWLALFIGWTLLGLPVGPGETLHLPG